MALAEKQDGNGKKRFRADGSLIVPGEKATGAGKCSSKYPPNSAVEVEASGSDGKRSAKRRRSAAAGASQPAGDAPSGQSAAVAKRSKARHPRTFRYRIPVPPLPNPAPSDFLDDSQPSDPVLKAISDLSQKVDKMALKTDLDDMTAKLASEAISNLSQAVEPLKTDISDRKRRLTTLESSGSAGTSGPGTPPQAGPTELHKLVFSFFPARKRVLFSGWPDTFSADARIKHIETLLSQHAPDLRTIDIDNVYQGPYNRRTLSKVACAEFPSADSARRALDLLKSADTQIGSSSLSILVEKMEETCANELLPLIAARSELKWPARRN